MPFTLATVTVEIDTLLWVSGILLGVIGFLAVIVGKHFNDSLTDLSNKNKDLEAKIENHRDAQHRDIDSKLTSVSNKIEEKVELIHKRISDEQARITAKHDDLAKRAFEEIDKTKEKCSDLGETVAGIGAVYVTRNEFNVIANRSNGPHV